MGDAADAPRPKKRGRPRAVEPGVRVSTYLREDEYQQLYDAAKRDERSISATVADWLRQSLRPLQSTPEKSK